MATIIRYKVLPTGIRTGEKPLNRYVVLHNGTVREDTVFENISRKSGLPKPMVKATCGMFMDTLAENLGHGYRVETPDLSAFLSIPGLVESASAESRRAAPPVLQAHLVAKGDFKKCCQGPEFVLENITKGATVVISGVIDGISQTPDTLTNGVDVEVHATGNGLYMPDISDPAVGVYLADSGGEVLCRATVTESTSMTLACVFPEIGLRPGTYRFCVASRNGFDPEQYGVTVGRRNVKVVDVQSENEGGQNG